MKTFMKTALSLTALSAVSLSGCLGGSSVEAPSIARHQIQVAESIERLELYPRADGMTLSARDEQAMLGFLSGYGRDGHGPIFVNAPSHGSGGVASARAQVRTAMAGLGLSAAQLQEGTYPSQAGAPAPLVVSYRRLKTLIPDCRWAPDYTLTGSNSPSADWGCAYHANIAAMVGDPNQFLEPYPFSVPDAARRMVIYDKYINGEPTGATRPANQNVSSQE